MVHRYNKLMRIAAADKAIQLARPKDDTFQSLRKTGRKSTKKQIDSREYKSFKNSEHLADVTEFQLKHLVRRQEIYSVRCISRMKFKKYVDMPKTSHRIVKRIVNEEKVLFLMGNWSQAGNSPIKGHVRWSKSKFIQALRAHCTVELIDEFRTSKTCSSCYGDVSFEKRMANCASCHLKLDRDVNAAKNIHYVGLARIYGHDYNDAFKRTGQPHHGQPAPSSH